MMGRRLWLRLGKVAALAAGLAAVSAFGSRPQPAAPPSPAIAAAPIDLGPDIADFYRDRAFRPIWIARRSLSPEARRLLHMTEGTQWRSPELLAAVRATGGGDTRALTRADLLLTQAYVGYVREHHRPPRHTEIRYIDDGLAPRERSASELLDELAGAPSLRAQLDQAQRINPAFEGLQRGLGAYRASWSRLPQLTLPARPAADLLRRRLGLQADASPRLLRERLSEFQRVHGLARSGAADAATVAALNAGAAHFERLILANIERARAIPARPRGRYILVDSASARLWMVEEGRIAGSMRVVVGKRDMPTPAMAGLIRYAVLNPYWNLPPDLIRERARKVLRRGVGAVAAERLQILSDWGPRPRPLAARQVDWRAVAAGRRYVNLRQLPGPANMMGAVKFMMPNDVGVYLHDTPLRDLLSRSDRHLSSGCVRLEDAALLARWLFGGRPPSPSGAPEQRADLPEPVAVYIAYFTALPSRGGVVFQPDTYGRDRTLLANLVSGESAPRREGRARP